MVHERFRHVNRDWDRALQAGRQYDGWHSEWQRLALYALTDALTYNYLAVGAIVAYLQQHGIDEDLLRRHTQGVLPDRYVTRHALDHLAGLLGSGSDLGAAQPTWTAVGRQIAHPAT
ncbi:hypothetical protein [Streptomyces sp. NPDC058254]|uniref:hypothetical protein n=1 Tax=Streptomyces sp. NPDC058254 TaxID=3346406 RepID=UPI0036E58E8E